LTYDGRLDEAETALGTASRLNPVIPSSYSEILGEIRFLQGRYDDAIIAFERALRINPTHMRARMWLIATLVQTGSLDEAQWQTDALMLSIPGFSLAHLQYAFPFRDQTVREKVLQSLRQAGLPE
jgi:tetratricopeptide (TPR) repeat protein